MNALTLHARLFEAAGTNDPLELAPILNELCALIRERQPESWPARQPLNAQAICSALSYLLRPHHKKTGIVHLHIVRDALRLLNAQHEPALVGTRVKEALERAGLGLPICATNPVAFEQRFENVKSLALHADRLSADHDDALAVLLRHGDRVLQRDLTTSRQDRATLARDALHFLLTVRNCGTIPEGKLSAADWRWDWDSLLGVIALCLQDGEHKKELAEDCIACARQFEWIDVNFGQARLISVPEQPPAEAAKPAVTGLTSTPKTAVQSAMDEPLIGKDDICDALQINVNRWAYLLRLSHKSNGPLKPERGGKTVVSKAALLLWWDQRMKQAEQLEQKKTNRRASVAAVQSYGRRDHDVPGVGGHVTSAPQGRLQKKLPPLSDATS